MTWQCHYRHPATGSETKAHRQPRSEPERVELFRRIYPGWFVFGGDGGGELFALDLTGEQPWPVIGFDGIDPKGSVEEVAESFGIFMQFLAVTNNGSSRPVLPIVSSAPLVALLI